jgi:uncharacterized membrane protein
MTDSALAASMMPMPMPMTTLADGVLSFEPWQLLTRWFHVLPASFAIGTSLFLYLVLQPSAKELPDAEHDRLKAALRGRLGKWVHISITLLLVTGLVNYLVNYRPQVQAYNEFTDPTGATRNPLYHILFGVKFLLAMFVFASQSFLVGRSALAQRWQASARFWVGVNVLALLAIVAVSGYMTLLRQGYLKERAAAVTITLPKGQ